MKCKSTANSIRKAELEIIRHQPKNALPQVNRLKVRSAHRI